MTARSLAFCAAVFVLLTGAVPVAAQDSAVPLIAASDPAAGAKAFLRCKACHTTEKGGRHRLGPNLWDVVGRKKASANGFKYSKALQALDGVWDYDSLDRYLENPRKVAPGNRMAFAGLKNPAQRAAVIAYLRTLSDSPTPLPQTAAVAPAPPVAEEEQDFGGLPPGDGRDETHAICGACHSLRLVTQQGLDAARWDGLMDWMTEKQGMPALDEAERRRIVSYLAEHFGPDRRGQPRANPMAPAMPSMPMMAPMAPPMPATPSAPE